MGLRAMRGGLTRFLRGTTGATSAEFVLILPIMIVLVLGTINISAMVYGVVTLNYAAQDAARCRAVKTSVCADAAGTETYALSRLKGPVSSPVFVSTTTATCSLVTATASFNFSTGLANYPATLSASACYPLQPA